MKVRLISTKPMNIPLTPEYCRHSGTAPKEMTVTRWGAGPQDSSDIRVKREVVKVCPSLDLVPGVPSKELHTAVLNIPQVELAIRGRLIRKEMVQ